MPTPEYNVSHTCHYCGHTDYFETTRREAAFCLIDPAIYDKIQCSKCGRREYKVWGFSMCELSRDLFIEWAQDHNLHFLDQDEDLIIAEEKYLADILYLLDNNLALPNKRLVLISALCVMIYDSLRGDEPDKILAEKVIAEFRKRTQIIAEASTSNGYISSYITNVVFPLIGANE